MNARRTLFVALVALAAPLAAEAAKSPFSLRSLLPGRGAAHPSTAPTAPRVTPPPRVGPYSLRPDTVIVFGPNTYTRTSGGTWTVYTPSLSISSFDSTRRFIFRIRNGSGGSNRVSQVSIVLNGTEVMNASDITTSIDSAIKVVQPHASNTLQVSVAGSNGAYINLDMISTPDPSYVIAGPVEYEIPDPPDDVEPPYEPPQTTGGVSLPSGAAPPYTVSMWNPQPSNGFFINARLSLNGTIVIPWTNLTGTGAVVTRQVALSSSNSYIVKHSGDVGALVDWQFSATDTTPPVVTMTSPSESTVTLATKISVAGSVSDETQGTVQVNSLTSHATPGSFADSLSLTSNQWMTITIHAQNSAGYGTDVIRHALRDTLPPRLTDSTSTTATTDTTLRVFGSWADTSQTTVTVAGAAAGTGRYSAFSLTVPLDMGENVILIRAVDAVGNKTEIKHYVFRKASDEPSVLDSSMTAVATALSETNFTTFYDAVKFLYTASSPLQTGVTADSLRTDQVAVLKGRVLARDANALPNVTVSVLGHPEFGHTLTRADGAYDLLVNGGAPLTLVYSKFGYLQAQRQVAPAWQDYMVLDDVGMIGRTAIMSVVDSSASQVIRGRFATDGNGDRDIRMLFSRGTVAQVLKPDNTTATVTGMRVRASEFTIGSDGPKSMPALLPSGSAYTYCVDLRLDEADSTNRAAPSATFTKPVVCYVKNFLHLPVGTFVPSGWYDQAAGTWKADSDGIIVKVVGVSSTGDTARIDSRGTGSADPQGRLDSLGVTGDELVRIKSQYAVGDTVWRVRVSHFSIWDFNFNFGAALTNWTQAAGRALKQLALIARSCISPGSIIECDNRVLGERFPIVGTPYTINYRSFRAPGDIAIRTVRVPIVGDVPPTGLKKIYVVVKVVGRQLPIHTYNAPIAGNTVDTSTWDGFDGYGRRVQGSVTAQVSIGYQFDESIVAGQGGQSLGNVDANGETVLGLTTFDRDLGRIIWNRQSVSLGAPGTGADGLGGWTISPHHVFDNAGDGAVYLGDGSVILGDDLRPTLHTFMGGGTKSDPFPYKGVEAAAVALGPDGSLYVADNLRGAILRVTRAGVLQQLAGQDQPGYFDSTSTNTPLKDLSSLALGPDGSVYFSSTGRDFHNNVVCRIKPDGTLVKVIGGQRPDDLAGHGDGGPASKAMIVEPKSIAVGPDGSLFIGDNADYRIRRILPNGMITTYAGTGKSGSSDSTGPARQIQIGDPYALATDAEGNLYSCEADKHRVRQITPDGLLITFATGGNDFAPLGISFANDGSAYITSNGTVGGADAPQHIWRRESDGSLGIVAGGGVAIVEGIPASAASIKTPTGIAAAPDGSFYFCLQNSNIYRVSRFLASPNANEVSIPSVDGSEVYFFSSAAESLGRHLRTRDALTGAVRYRFGYNAAGQLITITNVSGLTTTIQRDGDGKPIAIVGPFGHRNRLALTGKYLSSVTDTLGHVRSFTYGSDGLGLLASYADPSGNQHSFDYAADGRLWHDTEPTSAGGVQTLTGTFSGITRTVSRGTAESRTATYVVTDSADGTRQRRVTGEDGLRTASSDSTDGALHTLMPDGATSVDSIGPDARFGMTAPVLLRSRDQLPSGAKRWVETARSMTTGFNPPVVKGIWSEDVSINSRTAFHSQFSADSLILRSASPLGRVSATRVDSAGRPLAIFIPGLDSLHYVYDGSGRLHQSLEGGRLWQYDYDGLGRLSILTDPLGRVTTFGYDGINRLRTQTLPDSQAVTFGYDSTGNLASLTPPGRNAHTFDYDAVDQAIHYVAPSVGGGSTTTTYSHNRDHQLTGISRPNGAAESVTYESGTSRLRAITIPRGSMTYRYLATGQIDSVTSPDGEKVIYGYDGPLPLSETWRGPVVGRVEVTYDSDFRPIGEMVDSSATVIYRYDFDGLLAGAGVDSLHRIAANGLLDSTYLTGRNLTSSQNYDNVGALRELHYSWSGGGSFYQGYVRDSLGRITSLTEAIAGDTARTYGFIYTTAGRLREVDRGSNVLARFDYDANGNRTAANGPGGPADSTTATCDAQDRLLRYGNTAYSYTANGELTLKIVGTDTTTYSYDELGNLTTARLPDGTRIDYIVDGQNRRVGRRVNGHWLTGWLYENALHPVAELDSVGNVTARYVYGSRSNVPDYVVKNGVTYRIIADHLGSVRLVVDSLGTPAEQIAYDVFGRIISDSSPGFVSIGFAGGITDPDTKFVRFGVRDYDPVAGRWAAKDPLGFAGGSGNLFAYANNDPVNLIDPWGADADDDASNDLNSLAGTADRLTCGLASHIRDRYFAYNSINRKSRAYRAGWEDGNNILVSVALGPTEKVLSGVEAASEARQLLNSILLPGGEAIGSAGSSEATRLVQGSARDAENLFLRLAEGGVDKTPIGHAGILVELPGEGYVGYRPISRSGPPTIDINIPGIPFEKIKVIP